MPAVMRFVACTEESCPMNETRQCRSPFVAVDGQGSCLIRAEGPFSNKAGTEGYVEIRECRCQKCNSWELDEVSGSGQCGLGEDLAFVQHQDEPLNPKCKAYERQIGAPAYTSKI